MKEIKITNLPIELCKLLKFMSLVSSGGEAKFVISEGQVRVNGIIETQKRKKIVQGDKIEFQKETLYVK